MYVKRKMYSTYLDDEGYERLFSTTEFMDEDSYLDEMMYSEPEEREYGAVSNFFERIGLKKKKGIINKAIDEIADKMSGKKTLGQKTMDFIKNQKEGAGKFIRNHKLGLGIGAGTLATAGAAYGGYKLYKHNKDKKSKQFSDLEERDFASVRAAARATSRMKDLIGKTKRGRIGKDAFFNKMSKTAGISKRQLGGGVFRNSPTADKISARFLKSAGKN